MGGTLAPAIIPLVVGILSAFVAYALAADLVSTLAESFTRIYRVRIQPRNS
jgi:hypothetical protein